MVWLTPAMDGLFMGPASERRRFLDRLIACFDPGYRPRVGQFERAMQQRNRLLAEDVREPARFRGFERIMAETGVAIAAARAAAVAELQAAIDPRRRRRPAAPSLGPSWRWPARWRPTWRAARPSTWRTTICARSQPDASATAPRDARWRARTAPT